MSDERELLLRRERGEAVEGDFSKYERLQQALRDRQATARAPAGFEDKLWAAVDGAGDSDKESSPGSSRGRLALWGAVAAIAAAVLLFVAVRPSGSGGSGADGPRLAVTVERGAQVMRGGNEAQPGDSLRVAARPIANETLEVRLYRDDDTLVARCSAQQPGPACLVTDDSVLAVMPLERVGVHHVVVLRGEGDWPTVTGSMDGDLAAAMEAGASVDTRRIDVR